MGTYNVHDTSIKKFGDYYYLYSTDAIFAENREEAKAKNVPLRYIQVRKSLDLVNWEFVGWAFPEIPEEAVEWVRSRNEGRGATNIWAPYVMKQGDVYRLYFSVSAFKHLIGWRNPIRQRSPGTKGGGIERYPDERYRPQCYRGCGQREAMDALRLLFWRLVLRGA